MIDWWLYLLALTLVVTAGVALSVRDVHRRRRAEEERAATKRRDLVLDGHSPACGYCSAARGDLQPEAPRPPTPRRGPRGRHLHLVKEDSAA